MAILARPLVYSLSMNPTLQSQLNAAKRNLLEDLSGLIQKAAKEAVQHALSTVTLGKSEDSSQVKIRTNAEGKFEAKVGGRRVTRTRRRDLVRYARTKGFSAA